MINTNYKNIFVQRSKRAGFTLIELLVVIAIIGILASIVMGQLTSARSRAANVAIKANLANLRTQAGLFYTSGDSYNNVCADPIFVQGLTQVSILGAVPANCFDSQGSWVVAATLKIPDETFTNWCADSTGKSKGIDADQYAAITSATTLCP